MASPIIALVGNIVNAPFVPAGAQRATVNVQLPPGEGSQQGGFITVELPIAAEGAAWQATHAYTLGQTVKDSNGNMQQVVTAGTSGGSAPTWKAGLGAQTTDGSVVWQEIGTAVIDLVAGPCTVYITQP